MQEIIERFLDTSRSFPPQNTWLKFPGMSVYVRHTERMFGRGEERTESFEFANLDMKQARSTRVLQFVIAAEEAAAGRGIAFFVENVHNPVLVAFFRRRKGYVQTSAEGAPSFVKR